MAYDPRNRGLRIRALFVGESPPRGAPRSFFYNRSSILYYATFLAFHLEYGVPERGFLEYFRDSGYYLYDLFEPPGTVIGRVSKRELEEAEARLMELLLREKPEVVVVVLKRVFKEVRGLLEEAKRRGLIREYYCLPFPANTEYFKKYVDGLRSILRRLAGGGSA